jgi:hypothetical protein
VVTSARLRQWARVAGISKNSTGVRLPTTISSVQALTRLDQVAALRHRVGRSHAPPIRVKPGDLAGMAM